MPYAGHTCRHLCYNHCKTCVEASLVITVPQVMICTDGDSLSPHTQKGCQSQGTSIHNRG